MNWPLLYSWVGSLPCPPRNPRSLRVRSPLPHADARGTGSLGWRACTTQLCSSWASTPSTRLCKREANAPTLEEEPSAVVPSAKFASTREQGWVHAPRTGRFSLGVSARRCSNSKLRWSLAQVQHVVPSDPLGHFWASMGAKRPVCCTGSEASSEKEELIK